MSNKQYNQIQIRKKRIEVNGGKFNCDEWSKLCDVFDGRCVKCGNAGKLVADHIVPVAKGGTSSIFNIQPLCVCCNSIKGHREEIDYRLTFGVRFGFIDDVIKWRTRLAYLYSLYFLVMDFDKYPERFIDLLQSLNIPEHWIRYAAVQFQFIPRPIDKRKVISQ